MEPRQMMGFESPGDRKVPVTVRDWDAMKRAVWRSAKGLELIANSAVEILDRCEHVEGCPGANSDTEPCAQDRYETQPDGTSVLVSKGCPDRELRMSALVILTAAQQAAPVTLAPRPADDPYFAPSREYFSEVLSSLAAAQIEIAELRKKLGLPEQQPIRPVPAPQLSAKSSPTVKPNRALTALLVVATCGIYGVYLLVKHRSPEKKS